MTIVFTSYTQRTRMLKIVDVNVNEHIKLRNCLE